jgi:hypothetical protein
VRPYAVLSDELPMLVSSLARAPLRHLALAGMPPLRLIRHDGQGMCLFAKRLERGRFIWPSSADGLVTITPAQRVGWVERSDTHQIRAGR